MRRMGDVWKTTTNRSSRNAQLTPASPKQCLTVVPNVRIMAYNVRTMAYNVEIMTQNVQMMARKVRIMAQNFRMMAQRLGRVDSKA
uniref:Uncharacterized protein n=1 Tax=Trichogramma kaykai TaxID=54128 RepID=A0ABD2W3T1_9HYME